MCRRGKGVGDTMISWTWLPVEREYVMGLKHNYGRLNWQDVRIRCPSTVQATLPHGGGWRVETRMNIHIKKGVD